MSSTYNPNTTEKNRPKLTTEEIAAKLARLERVALEGKLLEKDAEIARLKGMVSAASEEGHVPHPELGNYVRIRRMKGGYLRFYIGDGLHYESLKSERVDELMEAIGEFYLTETSKRRL